MVGIARFNLPSRFITISVLRGKMELKAISKVKGNAKRQVIVLISRQTLADRRTIGHLDICRLQMTEEISPMHQLTVAVRTNRVFGCTRFPDGAGCCRPSADR